jgi:hypothetical protein
MRFIMALILLIIVFNAGARQDAGATQPVAD